MRLAEEITVIIANEQGQLWPSLRYAIQLERRPGSFGQLIRDVMDGSLTAAVEIIEPHCDLDFLPNRVFDQMDKLQAPLLQYIAACAGVDRDDAPKAAKSGKPAKSVPFRDYLEDLYKKATGWLGWTPQDALDATPAEIVLAYQGKLDMLKAIYGGGGKSEKTQDERPLDDKFRSIFAGIGTTRVEEAA